jgi:hypothetical protein
LVGNAKKKKNQNEGIQSECLVKFVIKNVTLNDFLLILFHDLSLSIVRAFIGENYQ